MAVETEVPPVEAPPPAEPVAAQPPPPATERAVVLTRPKWTTQYAPQERAEIAETTAPASSPATPTAPVEPESQAFTLRFASDAALMRAVAAHRVGVYAIEAGRARRMTVSDSRVSFWDASMPNSFHEMEPTTVPEAVVDALARNGTGTDGVSWGVTLPGRMKTQLDALMEQHRGGGLIIDSSGEIHLEAQQ